ncbi:hypothetical protein FOZ61_004211, partial [Perkinsus olseni]
VSVLWHLYNVDSLDLIYPSIEDVGTKRLLYSGDKAQASWLLSADTESGHSLDGEIREGGPPRYGAASHVTLLDYHSVPGTEELEEFVMSAYTRAVEEGASRINFFLCGPDPL